MSDEKPGVIVRVELPTLECKQCGHLWTPRQRYVFRCPKCQSVWWNIPPEEREKIDARP